MSSYSLRRCARPISWSDGTFSHRRKITWHKLFVHGRLRGPRLLLCRNSVITCCSEGNISLNCCLFSFQTIFYQRREKLALNFTFNYFSLGAIQGSDHNSAWKPWKSTNYTSLWLLWRMPSKVWKCQCLEIFYWPFRLPAIDSSRRKFRKFLWIIYFSILLNKVNKLNL